MSANGLNTAPDTTGVSLASLRAALERAERLVVRLDGATVEEFLILLDRIEQMFASFGPDQSPEQSVVRGEAGRWASLLSRITETPHLVTSAAAHAGGLAALRTQHPPAQGIWWHLDEAAGRQRAGAVKRWGIIAGAVAVVALLIWGVMSWFGGSSTAAQQADATARIEQLVQSQAWQQAQAVVDAARQKLPDDAELMVWDAVLAEQLGDTARSQASQAQAQTRYGTQIVDFWTQLGNDRLLAGNLAGAQEAADAALALAPRDPEVTFLLGGVAEARGDLAHAADYFSQTAALAADTNPQLALIAKVRMGYLTPGANALPGAGGAPPITTTSGAP